MTTSGSEPRPFYWSLRREIWENRSVYVAPLIVFAVVLFASIVTTIGLAMTVKDVAKIAGPFHMAPAPIMFATFVVALFYCHDALYGERRDRSILFWKSLPVSDRTAVFAKAAVPMIVLPSIAYVLGVISQLVLLFAGTLTFVGSGRSPAPLWDELQFFPGLIVMAYGLWGHVLWFAPLYGYVLLITAWAKRAPSLWIVLPPLALAALETIMFGTMLVATFLQYRIIGAMKLMFRTMDVKGLSDITPGNYLASPGLWLGLVFFVACIVAAARLRRNREPI